MSAHQRHALLGSCHCGSVRVAFATHNAPASVHPRACDCSFCRKHGASYVSDPEGALSISCPGRDDLISYRQGSEAAQFLMCRHCGVLVAVIFEHASGTYGAVNSTCLERSAEFAAAHAASPQRLSAEDKVARWLQLWIPNVSVRQGVS